MKFFITRCNVCLSFVFVASFFLFSVTSVFAQATGDSACTEAGGTCVESCLAPAMKTLPAACPPPNQCCTTENSAEPETEKGSIINANEKKFEKYGYKAPLGDLSIEAIIARLIVNIMPIIGSLFFIMFLWGGIQWFTAGGEDKKVQNARQTLTRAVIGMIIIFGAYIIVFNILQIFEVGLTKSSAQDFVGPPTKEQYDKQQELLQQGGS